MSQKFIQKYMSGEGNVGAVCASSSGLAKKMVASLDLNTNDPLVELGPGTGVFTDALLAAGMDEKKLLLVEFDAGFAEGLKRKYPRLDIVKGNARYLPKMLRARNIGQLNQIVSGLPFRSMSKLNQLAIGSAIAKSLAPGGIFVQFSYFTISPLPEIICKRYGLEGNIDGFQLVNVPPAFVFRYRKTNQTP